jgi:hypothetical protein
MRLELYAPTFYLFVDSKAPRTHGAKNLLTGRVPHYFMRPVARKRNIRFGIKHHTTHIESAAFPQKYSFIKQLLSCQWRAIVRLVTSNSVFVQDSLLGSILAPSPDLRAKSVKHKRQRTQ